MLKVFEILTNTESLLLASTFSFTLKLSTRSLFLWGLLKVFIAASKWNYHGRGILQIMLKFQP